MSGGDHQRSELDQQRIGHVGQQNFPARGSSRGGRDAGRFSGGGGGGDAPSRRDQQYYDRVNDRGRQLRQFSLVFHFVFLLANCY